MRKRFACLLALCLSVTLLVGCNTQQKPKNLFAGLGEYKTEQYNEGKTIKILEKTISITDYQLCTIEDANNNFESLYLTFYSPESIVVVDQLRYKDDILQMLVNLKDTEKDSKIHSLTNDIKNEDMEHVKIDNVNFLSLSNRADSEKFTYEIISIDNEKYDGTLNHISIYPFGKEKPKMPMDKLMFYPSGKKRVETKAETSTTAAKTATQTMGEINALKKAKSYLDSSAFSKIGLFKQLEFEGFSNAESKYAVENCEADWNDQAVKKAESYLKSSSFSKKRLIDQLKFNGFTDAEATYGAKENGY